MKINREAIIQHLAKLGLMITERELNNRNGGLREAEAQELLRYATLLNVEDA